MSTFVGGKAAIQFRKDMEPLFKALQKHEKFVAWHEKFVAWNEWIKEEIPYSEMAPEDAALVRAFRKIKKTYGLFPEEAKVAKKAVKKTAKKK